MARTQRCRQCRSVLSAWEGLACACRGPSSMWNADVLYAVACNAEGPLHARDFVRLAQMDHGVHMNQGTAFVTLSSDPRFCWGGQGLYGLYRHGVLPGPRNLEQAARVLLVAAGQSLSPAIADYCLKQLGYRYNIASLRNAVARSEHISRDWYGHWDHPRGESAERRLRSEIRVVPPRCRAEWVGLRTATAGRIKRAVTERSRKIQAVGDPVSIGIDW